MYEGLHGLVSGCSPLSNPVFELVLFPRVAEIHNGAEFGQYFGGTDGLCLWGSPCGRFYAWFGGCSREENYERFNYLNAKTRNERRDKIQKFTKTRSDHLMPIQNVTVLMLR